MNCRRPKPVDQLLLNLKLFLDSKTVLAALHAEPLSLHLHKLKIPYDFVFNVDALSSGVKTVTNGDAKCDANTSQLCSYKWYNAKNETVSSAKSLGEQKPGQYKCIAQCEMNRPNDQCGFIAMEVGVLSPGNGLFIKSVTLQRGSFIILIRQN